MKTISNNGKRLYKDFLENQPLYFDFCNYMRNNIVSLLTENGIKFQSVLARVKNPQSLYGKILRDKKYSRYKDVNQFKDLVGARIVLYERERIEEIRTLIYNNYEVFDDVSPREGYDARNITIIVKDDNKFKNLKCEIQLVTLMSHAYLEFGHDIFYKDKEKLKEKNINEYKRLSDIYDETFKKVIQFEADLELIRDSKDKALLGHSTITRICQNRFIDEIENCKNIEHLNEILSDLNNMKFSFPTDKKYYDFIINNKLFLILLRNSIKVLLKKSSNDKHNFYINTKEFLFHKILETYERYVYFYIEDLPEIVTLLDNYSIENCNYYDRNKFINFCKNILSNDKSSKNYYLHEIVYNYITSDFDKNKQIKQLFAENYCKLTYETIKETSYNTIQIQNNAFLPNTKYSGKINNLIVYLANYSIKNNDVSTLETVLHIVSEGYCVKGEGSTRLTVFLEYIENKINELDVYCKYKVYEYCLQCDKELFIKHNVYKEIKSYSAFQLYQYLFENRIIDDNSQFISVDNKDRDLYIKDFVCDLDIDNEKYVLEICTIIDKYEDWKISTPRARRFLFNIGKSYYNSESLYKATKNIYIYLGMREKGIVSSNDLKSKSFVKKLLDAIYKYPDLYSPALIDEIFTRFKLGRDISIDYRLSLVLAYDETLFENIKYRRILIDYVNYYYNNNCCILDKLDSCSDFDKFISRFSLKDLKVLARSFSLTNGSFFTFAFTKPLFTKSPKIFRYFITQILKKHKIDDLNLDLMMIRYCGNFQKELNDNIIYSLNLLNKHQDYKVMDIIQDLVGDYDEIVENHLIAIVKDGTKYTREILELLRRYDEGTRCWKLLKEILIRDNEKKYYSTVDVILFSASGTGKYGLVETFNKKAEFFKNEIKNGNLNDDLNEFANSQIKKFKKYAESEKIRADKDEIFRREQFDLNQKHEFV